MIELGGRETLAESRRYKWPTALLLASQPFGIPWQTERTPQRRGEVTSYKQRERHLLKRTNPLLQAKILYASFTKWQIDHEWKLQTW